MPPQSNGKALETELKYLREDQSDLDSKVDGIARDVAALNTTCAVLSTRLEAHTMASRDAHAAINARLDVISESVRPRVGSGGKPLTTKQIAAWGSAAVAVVGGIAAGVVTILEAIK